MERRGANSRIYGMYMTITVVAELSGALRNAAWVPC